LSAPALPSSIEAPAAMDATLRRVILGASLGALFEWYDFFLYGSLSAVISRQFFAAANETTSFIFALLAFAAGAFVRPLGALVFGRLGDRVGRKRTFLMTIVIMGSATFLVGCLPGYASIGVAAPLILLALRLLQGLALGGEHGGAVIYVAEHTAPERRGRHTAWVQTTGGAGLALSLIVILVCQLATGDGFERYGWRIPFLLSSVLLAISVYIRLHLSESPVFRQMQQEGALSRTPLREALGRWVNVRTILVAIVVTSGMAVTAYTAHLYALLFMQRTLKIGATEAGLICAAGILLATPIYLVAGALSDRIGRKPVVLGGLLLSALTASPLFHGLTHFGNPALKRAMTDAPVAVIADPAECSFQFDPVGRTAFTSSCDVAKSALARAGVPYENVAAPGGSVAQVRIGAGASATSLVSVSGEGVPQPVFRAAAERFSEGLGAALRAAGYPSEERPGQANLPALILIEACLVAVLALTYAPLAPWLVELFAPRIRYTSVSVSYHIANGWFGAFLPAMAFAIVAATGRIYSGLWYTVAFALVAFLAGVLFLPETRVSDRRRSAQLTGP
jgi:MFS family permease